MEITHKGEAGALVCATEIPIVVLVLLWFSHVKVVISVCFLLLLFFLYVRSAVG